MCPEIVCPMNCINGYEKDKNGCQTCKCYECPRIKCEACPTGYRYGLDDNRCQTCDCISNIF